MGIEIEPPRIRIQKAEMAELRCTVCGYKMTIPNHGYRVGEKLSFWCPICGRNTIFEVWEIHPTILSKQGEKWYPGKFLKEWKPLIPRKKLIGELMTSPPVLISGTWVDSEIDKMIEAKKAEWRAKGYSENLIRMAEDLARGWIAKMSEAFAPPEVKQAVARHITPKAIEVADAWIQRIGAAQLASKGLV
jgi:predicted RNA-binding Zn-ribbon protein involved in translation (DUF1610 family)